MTSLSEDEDSDLEFRRLPDYPTLFPYQADAHQEEKRESNFSSCAPPPSRPSNRQSQTFERMDLLDADEEDCNGEDLLDDDGPLSKELAVLGHTQRGMRASIRCSTSDKSDCDDGEAEDDDDGEADEEEEDDNCDGIEKLRVRKQERQRSSGTKRRAAEYKQSQRKPLSKRLTLQDKSKDRTQAKGGNNDTVESKTAFQNDEEKPSNLPSRRNHPAEQKETHTIEKQATEGSE